jgi:hypothetical protein
VSTGKAPIPIISLVMIAAVYGLQVRHVQHRVTSSVHIFFTGGHFHPEARVHVGGLDGDLHLGVCVSFHADI